MLEMERAVNYCRCSTEEESQRDALKVQTIESREWIQKKGWIHVDEYVEAKSGTQTKGRTEYQRLFDDMLEDKFDIIVIKDQDRLMRNTKDWYLFLDRMLLNGKQLFMYLENKYYTPDDALITGVRAILAEEYSRNLSKKINNAHKGRQEKGSAVVLNSNVYGFIKVGKQSPVINSQEAVAINRMYDLCIDGYGASLISRMLYQEGFADRQGNPFREERIRRIIRNQLYKGTVVMNRYHFNFETKQTEKNPPEDWIYHKGLVPAIVTEEKWEKANKAMDSRTNGIQISHPLTNNALSHKIVCGLCGKPYYRTTRVKKSGIVKEWKCSTYLRYGRKDKQKKRHWNSSGQPLGCDNVHIEEERLLQVLEQVRSQYYAPEEGDSIIEQMLQLLEQTLGDQTGEKEKQKLERRKERLERQKSLLLDKLLNEVITDRDYKKKESELEQSLTDIQKRIESIQEKTVSTRQIEQRLKSIRQWMENGGLKKATAMDMMEDIRRIIVYPDYLEIEFLPGRISNIDILKEENIHIQARYPFSWTTQRGRTETETKILSVWKNHPKTTVKEMAVELGIPYRAVLSRVNCLKQEGKVRYNGRGGNGFWEVLDT